MADQDIDKEQIRSASLSREGAPEVTLARSTDFACFLTNLSKSFCSSGYAHLPRTLASSADANRSFPFDNFGNAHDRPRRNAGYRTRVLSHKHGRVIRTGTVKVSLCD